ncbi:ROK family protein [Corynebacterium matruchotii]|uniref:ROK family protein n=1 Tax=Corynebacterium matruchotii TaxID=43768 RepID=UPI0028F073EF|nr:ROK family protein [Corynebacterium matruchotii]
MSTPVTIGFDIGGTNMRAGAITEAGNIIDSTATEAPHDADELQEGIVRIVNKFRADHCIGAVGLAIAGFLDPDCEIVRFAPHLPWRDRHARAELQAALGVPVRLEHDANAAAWGEYKFGGAQGHDNWVLFALGTGIGATLMQDGSIYRGSFGTAPEFGHIQVVPHGRPCACGKRGCLERYCSGTALEQTARELLADNPVTTSILSDHPELTGKTVMDAARQSDPIATAAVTSIAEWLGLALSMVVDILDPGMILIGGGMSADHDVYLPQATEIMAANIVGSGYRPVPTVSTAKLGGNAGMIGVADLARQLFIDKNQQK